jgi:hypothetical protein
MDLAHWSTRALYLLLTAYFRILSYSIAIDNDILYPALACARLFLPSQRRYLVLSQSLRVDSPNGTAACSKARTRKGTSSYRIRERLPDVLEPAVDHRVEKHAYKACICDEMLQEKYDSQGSLTRSTDQQLWQVPQSPAMTGNLSYRNSL